MPSISQTEKLMFTKHLGVMISAGIPLAEALFTLEKDSKNLSLARIILVSSYKLKAANLCH